ncbi:RICIN domain-containing protein [Streptomyces smaragdinus]|uniref:RICIN domain-containing protein n=1 Tax=Streptomyces smaragdinus TaxID=2585196 RepID=UPI003899DCC1
MAAASCLVALTAWQAPNAVAQPEPSTWSGEFKIRNESTNQYLIPVGHGLSHTDNVRVWAFVKAAKGSDWQWERLSRDTVRIRNADSRMCLRAGVHGKTPTVVQWTCSRDDTTQQWELRDSRDGTQIVNVATRQAIEPYRPTGTRYAVLNNPSRDSTQRWEFRF